MVALSSGEAEYYSLARGDYEVHLNCLTDSLAAKGITARIGVGKVKHFVTSRAVVTRCRTREPIEGI